MDPTFLLFLMAVIFIALVVLAALPSDRRIQRDPSTAFGRGRRALLNLAALLGLLLGAALAVFGGQLALEPVAGSINMVQVGGASLLVLGIVLIVASMGTRRAIASASAGSQEEVLDVEGYAMSFSPTPPPQTSPSSPPSPRPPAYEDGWQDRRERP
jgi:hypothetical protein